MQVTVVVGHPDVHASGLPVTYVQLYAGASATEADLLVFLKVEVVERAVLPRQVNITETVPLTAVGKIFKPALRRHETRDALSTVLKDTGIAFGALEVAGDKPRGFVASVGPGASASVAVAREVLSHFPLPFSVN